MKQWFFNYNESNEDLDISAIPFFKAVTMGLIRGVKISRIYGYVNDLDTANGERDIWDYGSPEHGNIDYTFPADDTAPIDSLSGSSSDDAGKLIRIRGLDINGAEVSQTIEHNGLNRVPLETNLFRVFNAQNVTPSNQANRIDDPSSLDGDVYIYENTALTTGIPDDASKVRAFITNGNNQTAMSQYTVPANYKAIPLSLTYNVVKRNAAGANFSNYVRSKGGLFRRTNVNALNTTGTGEMDEIIRGGIILDELSDITITANVSANDTGASVRYFMMLFDKTYWPNL